MQLRALVELRRQGTMRGAAGVLGYTAGAVSQQLTALERAVGTALLLRVGRRVEFTDAGRELAIHAQRILDVETEALNAIERGQGVRGALHVGVFATAAVDILPGVLARAQALYPELTVHTREVEVDAMLRSVATGSVDLAIGLDYPDSPVPQDPALRTVRLRHEPFRLAVPAGSFAETNEIDFAATGELDWILPPPTTVFGFAMRHFWPRHGVELRVRHEVADTAVSLAFVEAGLGVTPITDAMLRLRPSTLDRVDFREPFGRDVVAVVRSAGAERLSVAALLALLGESAA
ncbi:LysR family transcriptional regulator [Lentzea sp. CA-135723]|uniref:LysR family transcriptional regulator n=1 Tax=Lentzea sp. CA-135723 TaxID=3239950 RepID=UPI003D91BD90